MEDKKSKEELIRSLKRWIEIADNMTKSGDWDKCSLLHSFSDILSLDLQQAIKLIPNNCPCSGKFEFVKQDFPYNQPHFQCNLCNSTKN